MLIAWAVAPTTLSGSSVVVVVVVVVFWSACGAVLVVCFVVVVLRLEHPGTTVMHPSRAAAASTARTLTFEGG